MARDLSSPFDPTPAPAREEMPAFLLMLGVLALGAGGTAAIFWFLTPPNVWRPEAFSFPLVCFYLWQPGKTAAYLAGCLSTPLWLALGFVLARRSVPRLAASSARLLVVGGAALWLLIFACSLVPLVYCPIPPLPEMPPSWLLFHAYFALHPISWLGSFALLLGLAAAVGIVTRLAPAKRSAWVLVGGIVLWLLLSPARLYAPVAVNNTAPFTYHLNALGDALSQVANGRHFLIDFPHIYGGYVEFLGPVLAHLPRTIETYLLVPAVLANLGMLFLVLLAGRIVRSAGALAVTLFGLLALNYVWTADDHLYIYTLVRLPLPALGLWLGARHWERSGTRTYLAATATGAFAPLWNMDTGFVLWVSWTATLVARELAAQRWAGAIRHALLQGGALAGGWIAFWIYLRTRSGQWPHPPFLFAFQHLVLHDGYYCARILFPDLWTMVLLGYAVGLVAGVRGCLHGLATARTLIVLQLSLCGVGLFAYFVGRSAQPNIIAGSYPAILLAGMALSEAGPLIRSENFPRAAWAFLVPAVILLGSCATLGVFALPGLLQRNATTVMQWLSPAQPAVAGNAAWARAQTQPGESVYFLSGHSGLYYYLTDTVCPLRIPGTIELLVTPDVDTLVGAIRARALPKLFVDRNFFETSPCYKPEVYDRLRAAIAARYRVTEVSPDGRLTLDVPLP